MRAASNGEFAEIIIKFMFILYLINEILIFNRFVIDSEKIGHYNNPHRKRRCLTAGAFSVYRNMFLYTKGCTAIPGTG